MSSTSRFPEREWPALWPAFSRAIAPNSGICILCQIISNIYVTATVYQSIWRNSPANTCSLTKTQPPPAVHSYAPGRLGLGAMARFFRLSGVQDCYAGLMPCAETVRAGIPLHGDVAPV
jgi:hypothetical protein